MGRVKEVGFDEDHPCGAIVFGSAGHEKVAHGHFVARVGEGGRRTNDHAFALESGAEVLNVLYGGRDKAGAELGVLKCFEGDDVRDIFALPTKWAVSMALGFSETLPTTRTSSTLTGMGGAVSMFL